MTVWPALLFASLSQAPKSLDLAESYARQTFADNDRIRAAAECRKGTLPCPATAAIASTSSSHAALELAMSEDRENDLRDLSRREALLASGVGGWSLLGFCSACEAGEDSMAFGGSTPTKNISKLSASNPVIQKLDDAAALFKSGDVAAPRLSKDNVVSRIQEVLHKGDAARRLGRDRSVIRSTAAPVLDSDKSRVLGQLARQGFRREELDGAQVFFSRASLLDHDGISGNVKDLPVSKLVSELPTKGNLNFNTVTAVNFDPKSNVLNLYTQMNANRGAIRMSLPNFAVSPQMIKEFPKSFVDPPLINARLKLLRLVVKIIGPSEPTAAERRQCFSDCLSQISRTELEVIAASCGPCATALGAALAAEISAIGNPNPFGGALIAIACAGCTVAAATAFLACYDLCSH